MICKHNYVYGWVKYQISSYNLPGSGARSVSYFDWFYCSKFLDNQYYNLTVETNTYEPVKFMATPK